MRDLDEVSSGLARMTLHSLKFAMQNGRWRSKMSHANFKGGFWNFKIWIKRRVLLPILGKMTF